MRAIRRRNESVNSYSIAFYSLYFQHCSQSYEFGQRIFDNKCHLTDQKCGKNMVFINEKKFITPSNSIQCIQRCSCKDDYNYFEGIGECAKTVKISFS